MFFFNKGDELEVRWEMRWMRWLFFFQLISNQDDDDDHFNLSFFSQFRISYIRDKRDGLSKAGSGRVGLYHDSFLTHIYTLGLSKDK